MELIGADIFRVYATVIPPSFDPKAEIYSWKDQAFDEFDLGETGQGKYAATYANFTTPGAYSVVINAENAPGFADPVQTTITVAGGLEPAKLTGDVNNDVNGDVASISLIWLSHVLIRTAETNSPASAFKFVDWPYQRSARIISTSVRIGEVHHSLRFRSWSFLVGQFSSEKRSPGG